MNNIVAVVAFCGMILLAVPAFASVDPAGQSSDQNRKTTVSLLLEGDFEQARGFMDAWEKSRPEDKAKIDLLREVEGKVRSEPDEQKRAEIIVTVSMQQLTDNLEDFATKMQAMKDEGLMGEEIKEDASMIKP